MYLSAHAGLVSGNHSHQDVGAFVFDLAGYRWASDLGMEDYNLLRDSGGSAHAEAYRLRDEGHNVMLFDPKYDISMDWRGLAFAEAYQSKPRGAYVVYDMTGAYAYQVKSYKRGFYVGDNRRSVTIRDEYEPAINMTSYWFMTTPAKVELVDKNTAILTQGAEKVKLEFITDCADFELSVGPAQPLPTSPQLAGQNKNEGFLKIAVRLENKAGVPCSIVTKLPSVGDEHVTDGIMAETFDKWEIPDGAYNPPAYVNFALKAVFAGGKNWDDIASNGKLAVVEGEAFPEITAVPAVSDNIVEIVNSDNPMSDGTVIRVWTPDKSRYKDVRLLEYVLSTSANLDGYTRLDVTNVEVSSAPEPENHKMNMTDNDYTTRWTTFGEDEWAIFDIGAVHVIDSIAMAFWRGSTRFYKYNIYVSADGDNWELAANGQSSGTTDGNEIVTFDPTSARYVKYVCGGSNENVNTNILEFAIMKKN